MEPRIVDITEKFTAACKGLDIGQLVKDEYFTLFESIGAVEIMDPQMDSGFLQPGETLEDDYDPLTPILPEELIGIMDQLLCYEMAWHTGSPLSQTLFTSIHIDRLLWPEPKTLEEAQFYRGKIEDDRRPGVLLEVLRAYCLALVKGCDFVIAKITSRDYFEEEDFCTNTYNRVLFVQIPPDVFQRELDAAIELIEESAEIDESLRDAIITRLNFRKSLLTALDIEMPLDMNFPLDLDRPYSLLSSTWSPVADSLPHIITTHELAKPVTDAFSTKVQRRLASTVPPRPIVQFEFTKALEALKLLCVDCQEATRFLQIPHDPIEYLSFLWAFASRDPTPLTYSRSYLGAIMFSSDIIQAPGALPFEDLRSFVFTENSAILDPSLRALSPPLNPRLPKPPGLQLVEILDTFVDRAIPPYFDLWVALGQNKCRLRRMLTHVIHAWDALQRDAEAADAKLKIVCEAMGIGHELMENPLTTWVYIKKLWMIEKVILLGFEQEIHHPDEYAGMYFFLAQIASKRGMALIECLHLLHGTQSSYPKPPSRPPPSIPPQSDLSTQDPPPSESTAPTSEPTEPPAAEPISPPFTTEDFPLLKIQPYPTSSSTTTPSQSSNGQTPTPQTTYLLTLLCRATATCALASALHTFYATLRRIDLLPNPHHALGTPQSRQEARMKPFLTLTPEEVPRDIHRGCLLRPWGPYDERSDVFGDEFDVNSPLWDTFDAYMEVGRRSWGEVKQAGAQGGKAKGSEIAWKKEIDDLYVTFEVLRRGLERLRAASSIREPRCAPGDSMDLEVDWKRGGHTDGRENEGWLVARVGRVFFVEADGTRHLANNVMVWDGECFVEGDLGWMNL
ncbi:Mak10-domain-containing protein [Periconia macrospinosa]|uniref:Mak10-domain-containing protein n=1 Tax=Periconia macrospinosa TaxID=97972 RepID=A0A2V1DAL6_9PLEO|nr:Mak10-domain-containing protein [Periconia macrospinosa]